MKKIFFTLITAICTLTAFSQNKDLIINGVPLPDGNEKIDTNNAKDHVLHKFRNDKLAKELITGARPGYLYKIGNVLVSLNPQQGNVREGHFIEIKKGLDEMSHKNPTYTSEIESINNNIILTTNSTLNGVGYRRIYANNAANTKLFTALIEYNAATDSLKAIKIAEHIKNHLKFSN